MRTLRPPRPTKPKTARAPRGRRPGHEPELPPDVDDTPLPQNSGRRYSLPDPAKVTHTQQEPGVAENVPAQTPEPAEDPVDVRALQLENQMLRSQLDGYVRMVNTFRTPDGYSVEALKIAVDIKASKDKPSPGSATVTQFAARNEKGWESVQIDSDNAIEACWKHVLEEIIAERDELKRRWDQRHATLKSKERASEEFSEENGDAQAADEPS